MPRTRLALGASLASVVALALACGGVAQNPPSTKQGSPGSASPSDDAGQTTTTTQAPPGDDAGTTSLGITPIDAGPQPPFACAPFPGCTSTTSCQSGCSSCNCNPYSGDWICVVACDAGAPQSGVCPPSAPEHDTACSVPASVGCTYDLGCPTPCQCHDGTWACVPLCPPPPGGK